MKTTPAHRQFMARTADRYRAMVERFREKRDKNGRIFRPGREVPFTLEQFRIWVKCWFRTEEGCCPCAYCGAWIDAANFAADHEIPTSRGGGLELENLRMCCPRCNFIKGRMTGKEYRVFRNLMDKFMPETARTDVYHRLEIAVQLAAKGRWTTKKQKRGESSGQQRKPSSRHRAATAGTDQGGDF